MKVDINVEIDIDDVYYELSRDNQLIFIKEHLDDYGGIVDIVEDNYSEEDIADLVNEKIDLADDDILIEEVKRRGIEL